MDIAPLLVGGMAALLSGFAKGGMPGASIMAVPMMAMIWPARESVGVLLPLLVVGDLVAVAGHRHHADKRILWRLFPWVLLGMIFAAFFLKYIPTHFFQPILGGTVLIMATLDLMQRLGRGRALPDHPVFSAGTGFTTGLATTLGNAAGPVMNLYLLSFNFEKRRMVGTAAWFFFLVNLIKIPVFVWQGMITRETLLFDLKLAPLVVLGGWLGIRMLPLFSHRFFVGIVWLLAVLAGLKLLL